jgi:hypothetical protein
LNPRNRRWMVDRCAEHTKARQQDTSRGKQKTERPSKQSDASADRAAGGWG